MNLFPCRAPVESWLSVPFNRGDFVARLSQTHCRKGRKRVSPRFGSRKTGSNCEDIWGEHAFFRVSRRFLVRNPTSVSGGVLRAVRAQNPRFEKSKRGKFERDFFARGQKRRFEWRATQSYIAAARGNECCVRPHCEARNKEGSWGATICRANTRKLVPKAGQAWHPASKKNSRPLFCFSFSVFSVPGSSEATGFSMSHNTLVVHARK